MNNACLLTARSLLPCLPAAAPPGASAGHCAAAFGLGANDSSRQRRADLAGAGLRALAAK